MSLSDFWEETAFSDLAGKTIIRIEGMQPGSERIIIVTDCGNAYRMYHDQGCCEHVELVDVCGDVASLLHSPVMDAYESSHSGGAKMHEYDDSRTWTFYTIRTINGTVTLRWYGTSNGYYSERVDFERLHA